MTTITMILAKKIGQTPPYCRERLLAYLMMGRSRRDLFTNARVSTTVGATIVPAPVDGGPGVPPPTHTPSPTTARFISPPPAHPPTVLLCRVLAYPLRPEFSVPWERSSRARTHSVYRARLDLGPGGDRSVSACWHRPRVVA